MRSQRLNRQQCRLASCSPRIRVVLPVAALQPHTKPQIAKATGLSEQVSPLEALHTAVKRVAAAALGAATALSLVLSPAVAAEVVRLPASSDPSIFAAQRSLVEAWTIIGQAFVDPAFNGHDWEGELREHMMAAYGSKSGEQAYHEITAMLDDLGDPYTRLIPPEEYATFRVSSDGELQGVGMLIANEPTAGGHLLVLAPIKGGPADRAGILPGDELESINGVSLEGWNGEKAARLLRGKGGTEVRVRLARRTAGIPGVPARPEPAPQFEHKEVLLRRERVQLSPLFYAALPPASLPAGTGGIMPVSTDGRVRSANGPVGYIRLTSFSQNAAAEMREAIQELEAAGASSYILDLRNNPGGLVRSSIDVARLWMDGAPVVFSISGREPDSVMQQVVDVPGRALTRRPLVVLVNGASASASEILSGALHDNGRAVIVGDEHTYGKGRIQSVFELEDGSALFVTVAKYQTPGGTEIDRIGIMPDRACTTPSMLPEESLFMAGLPVGIGSNEAFVNSLLGDKCVVTARDVLSSKVAVLANSAQLAANIVQPVSVAKK